MQVTRVAQRRARRGLVDRGVDTFPQDDPAFSREAGVEGWACFADRLKAFAETA